MADAFDEMESCSQKGDSKGFYEAFLKYIDAGIDSTKNPLLKQIIMGIMPNTRRLQILSVLQKPDSLSNNIAYFKTILDALETRDVEKGVTATEKYFDAEKKYCISAFKSLDQSVFENNGDQK